MAKVHINWREKLEKEMKKLILWFIPVALGIGGLIWVSNINISADVGEAPTPGGIIVPGDKTNNVEMTREKVVFDIKMEDENSPFYPGGVPASSGLWIEHYSHVTAEFEMTNVSSTDEKMELAFPIPSGVATLDYFKPDSKDNQTLNVKVLVDGRKVDFEYASYKMATFKESTEEGVLGARFAAKEDGEENMFDVLGVKFSVNFKANKVTKITVEYDTRLVFEPKSVHGTFEYIMETGSHWKGKIGAGEMIFKFPGDITEAVFRSYNKGFEISKRKLVWSFKDLEPDSTHNIKVTYAPVLFKLWGEREYYIEKISASGKENVVFDWEKFPKGYGVPLYVQIGGNPIYLLGADKPMVKWADNGWIVELKGSQNPWVLYEFDAVYEVEGMNIKPGILVTGYKQTSNDSEEPEFGGAEKSLYNLFSRPKKVKLTFSDGSSTELKLKDSLNKKLSLEFDKVETSSVKVEILSTYPNHAGKDEYLGIARTSFDVGNKVREKEEEQFEKEVGEGTLATIKNWINENKQLFVVAVAGGFAFVASMILIAIKLRKRT